MLKKCLTLLVSLVLLVGILPLAANAQTEEERVEKEIRRIYNKVLYTTGRSSMHGYCGLMTSYQLRFLGVNRSPIMRDGNDQYDAYKDLEFTTGGNRVRTYPASKYNLKEALYAVSANGTQDVYNVLVGFQWTNTDAGARYGHACVINAILDGNVYFSESFPTPFGITPGSPLVCSIDEFARYYNRWTRFEGLVLFGKKDYTDFCEVYPSNVFVETMQDDALLSLPSTVDGEQGRAVRAGERLYASAVVENPEKELFYRIEEGGKTCYLKAENVAARWFQYEDVKLENAKLPETLDKGKDFQLSGKITSEDNRIDSIGVEILDSANLCAAEYSVEKKGNLMELSTGKLNSALKFQNLDDGKYELNVYALVKNYFVSNNTVLSYSSKVNLAKADFTVGKEEAQQTLNMLQTQPREIKTGWQYEDGGWRYYQAGSYRVGWFCYKGIDYFLKEDGIAATGWYAVNGVERLFTDTGAMRTGWVETENGTYYMLTNGVMAIGERTIDGKLYTFGSDGLLITENA